MKIIESDEICPVILTKVVKEWVSLENGEEEELVIITTWQAVGQELEKWCKETGNSFLGVSKKDGKLEVRLKLIKNK
ncbi:sulfurtransferase TusA family protein [Saccharolobus solfataricus]|uniref:Sulfurtransferase TusA family protein n=2 Tax=Saccharolobus solfataricus TaxID=2287 RepID=A0A0E3MCP3_SACSO|nr:sulfurtransferase TusA family protein [Saccharolobus solfataricus]AKA73666.1 sulfurtransferase TusA family protein [Saccharolobus solfataricus]AKA76363.1 sulfurtransferase TusA family protein [Saccharolobus solfataricus]AKA79055.1 sulfurtransferase TusA family protein [Saccharolobus solfataricus]AZF68135.1 sulfurtransferase TusA family protein [Saccharolobus solfataricus]AZF70755.1 sulfurtransferase TusA family protein [Saccharolobus solfataricus]